MKKENKYNSSIRLSEQNYKYIAKKASELGISQNALMNILLDLGRSQYYFSIKCLEILKALDSRLWISNQVKEEFEKNKDEVFNSEIKRYRKIRKNLNELVNNLETRILENILSEYKEKTSRGYLT